VIHGLAHRHADAATCTCPGCLSRRLTSRSVDPTAS
jgi:hypothetical protein